MQIPCRCCVLQQIEISNLAHFITLILILCVCITWNILFTILLNINIIIWYITILLFDTGLITEHRKEWAQFTDSSKADTSSVSSETDSMTDQDVWHITEEQREYYVNQFKTMQPDVTGVLSGNSNKCPTWWGKKCTVRIKGDHLLACYHLL